MPDVSGLEAVAEEVDLGEKNEMIAEMKSQNLPNKPHQDEDSSESSLNARASSASSRSVNNLGMDFFERQQLHMERQKKMYETQPAISSEQSGIKRAKFAAVQKENEENLRPRSTAGESASLVTRRLSKRKPPHHVSYMDSDSPRTPMPPSSSPPSLTPRSKTYFAMTSSTGKQRKRAMNDPYANIDRLQKVKLKAEKAIKNKKIFSIHGPYPLIRRALRERGWVEKEFKLPPRKSKEKGDSSDVDDVDDDDDDDDDQKDLGVGLSPRPDSVDDDPDNKYGIMGRMVRNEIPTFQWTTRNSSIDWRLLQKDQLVNHYAKANFTTKVGLCVNLRTLPCFANANIDSFFPRCYRLSQEEDKFDFIDDFRLVAATAMLRIAVDRHTGEESDGRDPEKTGQSPPGGSTTVIPANVLQLAINACELHAMEREHEDIDMDGAVCKITEENWNLLVQSYYKIVHEGATIENSNSRLKRCEEVLENMKELNLQYQTDGLMNTWIVKPGAKSRGRGIVVMNKLDEILKLVQCDPTLMKDGRWVIQKYIERPLLIYGTKFDIRQWFLVTDWNPMTVWMYKTSYLRFSSRPFSLKNLEPSIHLCNYSVQKNYEIDSKRHPMLPEDNMWSSDDFKKYLQSRGCESLWENLIYKGMKKFIIHMCQTAQDVVDYRKGSFELYGADFMIDEQYNPWLIEINSSPTMARSTAITSKMCAMVQEDTLKVVLDRKKDKNCNLGLFELAYKQPLIDVPLYVGKSLQVEGSVIKKPGANNNVRRSWGNNNNNMVPATTLQRSQSTSTHENKLIRTMTNHATSQSRNQQQQQRNITRPQVSKPTMNTRSVQEQSNSPVKLRMQTTLKRLTSEIKTAAVKPNALNLPRFASNASLHAYNAHSVPKTLSHSNLGKSLNTRGSHSSNYVGGYHCVSTTHAKAASTMGIITTSQNNGLIATANHGSLPLRNSSHQVLVPKSFPPSLVPGFEAPATKCLSISQGPRSGVMSVAPQTIGLTLPLQSLFGGDMSFTAATTKARQLEIYHYPGQDFRFSGPGSQRISGRLY